MPKKTVVMADVGGLTIREAFNEFIGDKITEGVAAKTIRNYEQAFQYFMELELDEDDSFQIGELIKAYVLQWIDAMTKRGMKVITMNSYLRIMRVFLYWCMDTERRYIEPSYKINLIKGEEVLPKVFTDDEVEKLLAKPTRVRDFVEWRTWAIVNWVVATGDRAATVCGYKIGDIDFKAREIKVRHLKSKKVQIKPMSHQLEMIMKTYIRACRSRVDEEAWLFPSSTEEQLTYNALAHSLTRYCKERGTKTHNMHALRHYFATVYARETGDIERLRRMLGHSTYDMTKRYMSLVDEDLRKDFDARNPLDKIAAKKARTKKVEM